MARALPRGGRLDTLELDPTHAAVARTAFTAAGVADRVRLHEGAALTVLPTLAAAPAYDLAFIDADKPSNPEYFAWALRLVRPGGLILVDNVVREGRVLASDGGDAAVAGVRAMVEQVAAEPRVRATVVQSVGAKGHDGLLLAWVRDDA
jgi:predicted O-methyltransferase YrrM